MKLTEGGDEIDLTGFFAARSAVIGLDRFKCAEAGWRPARLQVG
jgi:hypothetical protein